VLDAFKPFLGVDTERVHDLLEEAEVPPPDDDGWLALAPESAGALCTFIDGLAEEASILPGNELSPLRQLYRDWWAEFLPALKHSYPGWTAAQSPPADSWMNLPAGTGGVVYCVSFCGRTDDEKRLRAELYIDPPDGDALSVLTRLEERKDAIEAAFGKPLAWEPLPHRRACRVAVYSPERATVVERASWPAYRSWLVPAVGDLRQALTPHLDAVGTAGI
jgi:hypothetical protein